MISKDWTLPELIEKYPGTRRVFDEAGLHGCGGALGPHETVEFFARVHGVPLEKLIEDLEAAKDTKPEPYREDLGDVLYRRHFRAAIVVILTAGATLGASMLLLYGIRHSFTSLDLFAPLQAHANAQVFGWVGLFVMGFACQGLPRFKFVRLWRPELANLSFGAMVAGLTLRILAGWPWAGQVALGLAGGILEAAAALLFTVVIGRTVASSTTRERWERYVWVSLACFALSALLEPVAFWLTRPEVTPERLISRIADFMAPYRTLQLLGFAGFMVLGVSQRILPTAFGFRAVGARGANGAFALLAGGLAVDLGAWILFRGNRAAGWAVLSWAGTCAYAAGALLVAFELRAFSRGDRERSTKFIRAAFLWLAVASLMIFLEPLYTRALGVRFSHAYHGAIRHAFTVGFLSLMIVGVSSKVVPILQGIDVRSLPTLWIPFLFINLGNALRIASQVATDWAPTPAFPVMGMSGTFEVVGLGLWGIHLWRLMAPRTRSPLSIGGPITAERTVASLADEFPEVLEVFEEFGFKELKNPLLRNTLARRVTVRMACDLKHVDLETFLGSLRRRVEATSAKPPAGISQEESRR
ncbi:MAG TPA: DUF1858 domain-containing protein [Planctomycetota bacterium]|nr:DUF1858 domain-containing protein [Planctomycetota bacterium]